MKIGANYLGDSKCEFRVWAPLLRNRRPVDYQNRQSYLDDIQHSEQENIIDFIHELLLNKENGKIKLFLIYRMLNVRRRFTRLFNEGTYQSVEVRGKFRDHVIAFARNLENGWQITVAPRFLTGFIDQGEYPLGTQVWEDTRIVTPGDVAQWHHSITDQKIGGRNELLVGEIFQHFPAGCLAGEAQHD